MAKRGSPKARSVEHETFIARLYSGHRSRSSGAADTDAGDVRVKVEGTLFECKTTGEPGKPKSTKIIKEMEKIRLEAYEEGREPALALRYFNPDSSLADINGYVDLVVRLAHEDANRSRILTENGNQTVR